MVSISFHLQLWSFSIPEKLLWSPSSIALTLGSFSVLLPFFRHFLMSCSLPRESTKKRTLDFINISGNKFNGDILNYGSKWDQAPNSTLDKLKSVEASTDAIQVRISDLAEMTVSVLGVIAHVVGIMPGSNGGELLKDISGFLKCFQVFNIISTCVPPCQLKIHRNVLYRQMKWWPSGGC